MKKVLLSLILCSFVFAACSSNAKTVSNKDLLITEKTTQYFTDDAVPENDITAIVNAGINATSDERSDKSKGSIWRFSTCHSRIVWRQGRI